MNYSEYIGIKRQVQKALKKNIEILVATKGKDKDIWEGVMNLEKCIDLLEIVETPPITDEDVKKFKS